MATVIRLQRGGRTHAPYYRVVVMDSRNRTRGAVVDQIGTYHPCAKPEPTNPGARPDCCPSAACSANPARASRPFSAPSRG